MSDEIPSRTRRPLAEALWVRAKALRAFSFPLSILPVLVSAAAIEPITEWRVGILAVSVVVVVLLHAAGNLFNDYFDFRYGVDRRADDAGERPGRLLVHNELSPHDILCQALLCLGSATPAMAWLVWQCGPELLWFGAAGTFGLYAYTGPPFRLKHRALGEPLIFLVFGPSLMVGAAWAQTGSWEWRAFFLSLPVGLVTTAVLVGNNVRDREEDRAAGIHTIAHLVGSRTAGCIYAALIAGALAGVAAFGLWAGPRVLIAAPALGVFHLRPVIRLWRGERVPDIDAQTARFATLLLLFLLVSLVCSS